MVKIKKFINKAYSFLEPLFKEPKKHLKTWLVILGVLVASWAVVFFLRSPEPTRASWWDETWLYRRAIQISNDNGENLTDFQVAVTLDTASLIADGKMRETCDDLRITDNNGNIIPHWIEENNPGCNDAATKVWTKVPTVYDGTDATTVYVYYGNSQASNVENGDNVFEFFDDFSTDTTDNYTWSTVDTNSPVNSHNWSQENNWIEIRTGDNDAESSSKNVSLPSSGHAQILITKRLDYPSDNTQYLDIIQDGSNYYRFEWQGSAYSAQGVYKRVGGSIVDSSTETGTVNTNDTQYRIDTYWTPSKIILKIDGSERKNINTTNTTEITPTSFIFYNNQINQDWELIFISKYTSTEPTTSLDSEEISPGPVAYWKFDEGTGTTAYDSSGQGNDGTLGTGSSAPAWQTENMCISGKCLKFDGNDKLSSTGSATNNPTQFTVSAWVKLNQFNPTTGNIGSVIFTNYGGATKGHIFYIYDDGRIGTRTADGEEGSDDLKSINPISLNEWSFITTTYDGTNLKVFLNGKQENSRTATFDVNNNTAYIGSWSNVAHTYGFIDEVKIYPYARTEDQIKADYAAGLAGVGSTKGSSAIMGSSGLQSALNDGLVAYYKMDEASWDGSAGEVIDSSGNNNHGQGVGATPPTTGAGKYGNGGVFDGSDDWISINESANFEVQEHTLSAWINSNIFDVTNDYNGIVEIDSGTNIKARLMTYGDVATIRYHPSYSDSGNAYADINSLSTNTWYHVVGTWDGTTAKIFLNGEEIDSDDSFQGPISYTTAHAQIGRNRDMARYWDGSIDEVRIYNRALSSAEVKALYEWAPGPVAHYTFDDSSDSSAVADISGYGNNGTWSGSTTSRYAPGKYGNAGVFNGSDDYVDIGSPASLIGIKGSYTYSAWIKPLEDINQSSIISGASSVIHGLWFRLTAPTILYMTTQVDSTRRDSPGWTPEFNQWTHVAGIANAEEGYVSLYVNGSLIGETTFTPGVLTGLQRFYIGNGYGFFNGSIDDVRIYNYARTQKQILEDMQGSMPSAARMPQPIAHWRFDEGYGTTTNNSGFGGSDLNGTLGTGDSAPTWTNEGKVGKALGFEGSQYIALGNSSAYQIDNKTISFWAKPDVNIDNYQLPFYGGANWYVGFKPTNQMMVSYKISNGSQQTAYTTEANTVIPDEWHYYAYSFDVSGDNVVISFYKDGQHISSSIHTAGYSSSYASSFYLGGVETVFYYGLLDEVKVYNYALTEAEVKEDYNQGKSVVMGQSSANTGSTAPGGSASQEYCVPGSNDTCRPPVAEWLFNENQGTVARDTSGNGNDGSLGVGNSAPLWDVGHNSSGASLKFDGNDYVDTADINSIELNDTTISFWGKINNINKDNDFITKGTHSTNQPLLIWFDSVVGSGGDKGTGNTNTLSVITYDGSTQHWVAAPTNTINDTDWHFYSIVINPTGSKIEILVDGILVEQNTKSWNGIRDTATALRLGNPTPSSSAAGLDGLMDNVRIYDYARTPAQIAWDYNRGAPVGHWRFDECQGTTAYDVSGNDNHGTINIGATAPQTTTGTCTDGSSASAWYNGASGKWNSSLSFDGEDDYIEVGGDSTINVIDSITVSAWIFPEQYKYAVIAQKTYNTGLSYSWAYKWRIEGQDLYFGLYDTGDSIHRLYFDPKPNLNEWTHIVATYDGNIGKAYQNGIETDSFESSFSLRNDSNGLLIGGVDGGSEFFDGQIDDVRIYNYALTDEQVKTLYNQGAVHFGD